jgi:hypothetical protein
VDITKFPALPITHGIQELLDDQSFCARIALSEPDTDRLLAEIQLAVVSPESRDSVGPTLLALQMLRDALRLFTAKGNAVRKLKESTPKTK